jgi:hypothetical protein
MQRNRPEYDAGASTRAQAWWREYWRADFVRTVTAEIVSELMLVIGSPGEAYLRRCGIDTAAIFDMLERTDAIGWHPRVWFGDKSHPLHNQRIGALIGVMTDAVTAKPTGAISRTYLDSEGCKIGGAKMLSSPLGVVRLSDDADVLGGLHIAESIESALGGAALGFIPIWSVGSAPAISSFPVLSGIEALTILTRHDEGSQAGRLIQQAVSRWRESGREVRVIDLRTEVRP